MESFECIPEICCRAWNNATVLGMMSGKLRLPLQKELILVSVSLYCYRTLFQITYKSFSFNCANPVTPGLLIQDVVHIDNREMKTHILRYCPLCADRCTKQRQKHFASDGQNSIWQRGRSPPLFRYSSTPRFAFRASRCCRLDTPQHGRSNLTVSLLLGDIHRFPSCFFFPGSCLLKWLVARESRRCSSDIWYEKWKASLKSVVVIRQHSEEHCEVNLTGVCYRLCRS